MRMQHGMQGAFLMISTLSSAVSTFVALEPSDYRAHFIEGWPGPHDDGSGVGVVNQSSYEWAIANLPLFDSSDADLVSAYYYRAKSYKSHLMRTDWVDIKHVSSEFGPSVPWGGVYGTINAAAGHQIREGRWLRDRDFMDGLVRFWVGSQNGGGGAGVGSSGAFEPAVGHFANLTRGKTGSCPYSSWILSSSLAVAAVRGDLSLGIDVKGHPVTFADLLPDMVEWWEQRSVQLRTDCMIANGDKTEGSRACLDRPPEQDGPTAVPYCYVMADGWDAMEGSVSGNGCRPTIGAMMWSEALAIAAIANSTTSGDGVANATIAKRFYQRAEWIREWYLEHLWNDESKFLGVYKQGLTLSDGMAGCSALTRQNKTDTGCCCLEPGSAEAQNRSKDPTGHYANFSECPQKTGPIWPPNTAGNSTVCRQHQQTCSVAVDGPSCTRHSSTWPCGKPVSVRELLGLGPAYYFGIVPQVNTSAIHEDTDGKTPDGLLSKFDAMWQPLFDEEDGFWGKYGPTTVERRATCFNWTQDTEECNWAGPSWPYETSRVLTGLSNFLADYPPQQSAAAGLNSSHYTTLLRTYARSMTTGNATNGSVPWVGENIEPDKGFWIAHSIQYRGGAGTIDVNNPWLPAKDNPRVLPVNCSVCNGTCYDRSWAQSKSGPDIGGHKCDMKNANMNETLAKLISPCDDGCHCVPPANSYDYLTHSTVPCCKISKDVKLPDGTPANCDGKKLPTRDKDRGKDYNHSTFIDLIIEGLVGIRALLTKLLVVHPLADKSIAYFALDNLAYHGRNLSIVWDPKGTQWPKAECAGFCLFVDGAIAAHSPALSRLEIEL